MPTVKPLADAVKQPKAAPAKETVTVADESHNTVHPSVLDVKPAAPSAPTTLQPLGARVPTFLKKFVPPTMAGNANNAPAYVGFASDSSANWPAMQAAKLEVGEPFVCVNGQYLKGENGALRFWLAAAESFMSVVDQSYNYQYVTRNMRIERVTLKQQPTGKSRTYDTGPGGIQEHYLAYLFVLINGEIVPAKGDFMGTKSGAVASAVSAVRAAGSPDSGWLELSDAHRVTGGCPLPFGRVMCSMRTVQKLGKASGQTYHRGLCHTAPASMEEMDLLLRSLAADTFVQATESVHASFVDRIKFYDDVAAKVRPNVMEEKEVDSPVS